MEGKQGFVTLSLGVIKGSNTAGKTSVKQQWARHNLSSSKTLALEVEVRYLKRFKFCYRSDKVLSVAMLKSESGRVSPHD